MAIDVLDIDRGSNFRHDIRHNIESIFYVFFYVCMKLSGPHEWTHQDNPIDKWFDPKASFSDLAKVKIAQLAAFEPVLDCLPPYFQCFFDFFKSLWETMFDNFSFHTYPGNTATHSKVIGLFTNFYNIADENDPVIKTLTKDKRKQSEKEFSAIRTVKQPVLTWQGRRTPVDVQSVEHVGGFVHSGFVHAACSASERHVAGVAKRGKRTVAPTDRNLRSHRN